MLTNVCIRGFGLFQCSIESRDGVLQRLNYGGTSGKYCLAVCLSVCLALSLSLSLIALV